ncbi:sulfite reductase [NADPH] beta subunit [Globomyces pollinis-pini]|nr:sulfite reductase [NADPH] beta subunit [Globomyces pollinis-pini]
MNYGNAYVASISPSYSYSQAIQAIKEANAFAGPSIVILHAPKVQNADALQLVAATKKAIDSSYFTLYRYTPGASDVKSRLLLDSNKPKITLEKFLQKESNLALVINTNEPNMQTLDLETDLTNQVINEAHNTFNKLYGSLKKKKLLILYGSDGGNGESLAKRIGLEAKEKGLFTKTMAMDNFVSEDLINEENVLFVTSTAGQGEFPGNARETWKYLTGSDVDLSKVNYAVFALGDRHYWPRPEDAHYFVKAGKDLDARLAKLGAKPLVEIGVGDDRDPDGFYSGFNAWVPNFWTSLGVEAESIATQTNVPSDDAIKAASNYLRGTIAEGLLDTSTGALAEYDTKLTKFHGIYQQDDRDIREHRALKGLEKAFSFMIRVRVPGGRATPAQWIAMDDISDKWANGTIKLTTRQAFQFHGILKNVLKRSMQDINKSLLDTIAACGDVNRNVMCNPNPGDSEIHKIVLDFSSRLSQHLLPSTAAYHEIWLDKKLVAGGEEEPLYGKTYLPRKFKVAVAVPPSNDVDVLAHDLGYIAVIENGVFIGFNVTVGGGMGTTHGNKKTFPRLAEPLCFCTLDQAIDIGEKVMLVQRDYGDRTNRKHARLKYTIDDRGLDWFRGEVEKRVGYKLEPAKPYKFTSNGDRYGWSKSTNGKWSFTLFIQNGRVKDTSSYQLKTGLREIALVHKGNFVLTPNQHLVIADIDETDKATISDLLVKFGIDNNGLSGLRLNSMACVALPTCALAMAESERYLPSLVGKIETLLEENGLREESITIRMTGCPNGCARPSIAEIAFVGKAPGVYNMYLGGGFAGERLNKLYKESIGEEEILQQLNVLIKDYAIHRIPEEHFGDFVVRTGVVAA